MFLGERVVGRRLLAGVAMLNNRVAGTFSRNEDVYQDPATGNWFTNRPQERQLLHPPLHSLPSLLPAPFWFTHPLTLQTSPHSCPSSTSLLFPRAIFLYLSLVAETNQLEFSMHRRRIFPISGLAMRIKRERKVFCYEFMYDSIFKWNISRRDTYCNHIIF